MEQRTILFVFLLLVCLSSAVGQNVTQNTTCSPLLGPCFEREVFRKNLQYLSGTVLPEGWKLNAVVKWEGYGTGLKATAAVAAEEGHSVGVLHNDEVAAAASATPSPVSCTLCGYMTKIFLDLQEIFRIFPANYSDLVATIKAGYKTQASRTAAHLGIELASPLNIADLVAAGRDTNTTIPIHLYLYMHYDDAWGWNFTTPQQLQTLVDQLDKRYVRVVGFMMHLTATLKSRRCRCHSSSCNAPHTQSKAAGIFSYKQGQQGCLPDRKHAWPCQLACNVAPPVHARAKVACPVAASLAPQKIAVHWVNTDEALALIPKPNKRYGNYSMQPVIPPVCDAPNIEHWARMGTAIYGSHIENYADAAEGFGPGTAPVLHWTSTVKAVGETTLPSGAVRIVAVVDLSPARRNHILSAVIMCVGYAERLVQTAGAEPDPFGRPPLFVYIKHQRLQLADWPAGNGSVILVDVTDAEDPVVPGDEVCLLCEERPVGTFGIVS
ncbi:hypothetical protein COO60DRAFT_1462547 [Scenedesmus sp. NREL 46B-D3]|nr:hypothetical protein COO60DRAFT_1462547 [Scenedesmus sp. NREL 46B-D3]